MTFARKIPNFPKKIPPVTKMDDEIPKGFA